MTDASQPLFLFGPGYSATVLAAIWEGDVFGSVRSDESANKLQGTEIKPVSVNDADALSRATLGAHLVISAPPGEEGCPALAALSKMTDAARSVTYLSTTGVYGDLGGGWAMEWSPVNPQSLRSIRRIEAEAAWLSRCPNARIVRLPGIYGPGRSAFDRLKRGTARRVVKDGQVFSRIHVDDIATGLKALLEAETRGVFHICDDEAAPPQDVIAFAAKSAGVEVPAAMAFEDADLSPMGRSFYSECKRVSNARIKAATGWRPKYPNYRKGLTAILDAAG